MTHRLTVTVTTNAAAQIRRASHWWIENRAAAPKMLVEELERTFALISVHPYIGSPAASTRLSGVRRVLLQRTRYHVYYRVAAEREAVEVLALWHASRGAGPPV